MARKSPPQPEFDPNQPLAPEEAGEIVAPEEIKSQLEPIQETKPPEPEKPAIRVLTLAVPVFDGVIHGYCSEHVDIRLNRAEAELLRRVTLALNQQSARHPNGRLIQGERSGDTLHWLLGHLAEQLTQ